MQNRIQFVCRRFIFYCGCYLSYVVIVEHAIVYTTAGLELDHLGNRLLLGKQRHPYTKQNQRKTIMLLLIVFFLLFGLHPLHPHSNRTRIHVHKHDHKSHSLRERLVALLVILVPVQLILGLLVMMFVRHGFVFRYTFSGFGRKVVAI